MGTICDANEHGQLLMTMMHLRVTMLHLDIINYSLSAGCNPIDEESHSAFQINVCFRTRFCLKNCTGELILTCLC